MVEGSAGPEVALDSEVLGSAVLGSVALGSVVRQEEVLNVYNSIVIFIIIFTTRMPMLLLLWATGQPNGTSMCIYIPVFLDIWSASSSTTLQSRYFVIRA